MAKSWQASERYFLSAIAGHIADEDRLRVGNRCIVIIVGSPTVIIMSVDSMQSSSIPTSLYGSFLRPRRLPVRLRRQV